jgi:uncharacterized protein (TIGR01244 family)
MGAEVDAMRSLLVLSFAALLAAPVLAQVKKIEMPGIRNFSRVDATVGCGGQVDPSAMASLRKEGFVSVINLRQAGEPGADIDAGRSAAQAAGLKYFHLPFDAAAPDEKTVERFLATVADAGNQPVFVHCGSANRVGGVWMIKRALQDGWPLDRARAEAEAIGLRDEKLAAFAAAYIEKRR